MELSEIIGEIGIEGARWIEEHIDEQYKALEYLWRNLQDPEVFPKLVIMNALVSYQLSGRGEDWWWEFARWFSDNPPRGLPGDYLRFLGNSRYNRRLFNAKARRIERFWKRLGKVDLLPYYSRMEEIWKIIAERMGARPTSKTIVFSVKMLGYAGRIIRGKFHPFPFQIPIPVDLRIERLTRKLGGTNSIAFWSVVAKKSGVPPLHIDSIIWPLLGSEEKRRVVAGRFGRIGEELARLLE